MLLSVSVSILDDADADDDDVDLVSVGVVNRRCFHMIARVSCHVLVFVGPLLVCTPVPARFPSLCTLQQSWAGH